MRIDKDTYYLNIAGEVAKRSSCLRSAYGSVIVKNDSIKSTGYNGSCRGAINCCDTGICRRENDKSRSGYDACPAVHSEENGILFSKCDLEGSTLYVVGFNLKTNPIEEKLGTKAMPCWRCMRILVNAGIAEVCVRSAEGVPAKFKVKDLKYLDPISYEPWEKT